MASFSSSSASASQREHRGPPPPFPIAALPTREELAAGVGKWVTPHVSEHLVRVVLPEDSRDPDVPALQRYIARAVGFKNVCVVVHNAGASLDRQLISWDVIAHERSRLVYHKFMTYKRATDGSFVEDRIVSLSLASFDRYLKLASACGIGAASVSLPAASAADWR